VNVASGQSMARLGHRVRVRLYVIKMKRRRQLTSSVSNVKLAIQTTALLTEKALRRDPACGGGMIMFRIVSLSFAGFALLIGVSMVPGQPMPSSIARRLVSRGAALFDRLLRLRLPAPLCIARPHGVPKGCVMR
jgi:CBS domain containing-hemolysin-like protein